jgi:hypothetical protein
MFRYWDPQSKGKSKSMAKQQQPKKIDKQQNHGESWVHCSDSRELTVQSTQRVKGQSKFQRRQSNHCRYGE